MARVVSILSVTLVLGWIGGCAAVYGFVSWRGDQLLVNLTEYYADIPDVYVARATYSNEINQTGWAFLELETAASSEDSRQAYAAGLLEGYLTRDLIWMHWQNMLKGYCHNKLDVCGQIEEFVDKNEEYISDMVQHHTDDPYWYQVKLYYIQLEGLAAGYTLATNDSSEHLTRRDILWINMLGDLDDLAFAVSTPADMPEGLLFGDHCTGLVKLLPDLSDLYTSQVTWNSYQSMLRMQKMYALQYRVSPSQRTLIPGHKMSLSSYPAFVQSTDDFYVVSSGLVAAETTLGISERALFALVRPACVLEYARAMVANRLASSAHQWTDIFKRYNSGTYNNQWYIVDYKQFRARSRRRPGAVRPGLLWVLEQLPGTTEAADLTEQLQRTGYFPSYNIAHFPRMFNLSGGPARVSAFGDWFGYHTNPRARILAQKQATISNLREMFAVMRSNDFRHDPLARCPECRPPYSACNAVAARNDLNPPDGKYPFRALGHRSHGSTDAKVTSSQLRRSLTFIAVAGPAHNLSRGVPPFQWSRFDLGSKILHVGHPDLWVFPPVLHRWEWG